MAKQLNVNLAFSADTGKAKAQIQELQSLLSKIAYTGSTTSITDGMQKDLQQASEAAKELQFHLNNAFNATTGKFDLSLLDKSLKTSGSNIQNLSTQLLNAGSTGQQAFVKLAQSISLADQPMFKINNKLQEFATTMKNTVRWQLSSSMLHGFMGAIQSAYGYAQDLNESLTNIRIVTGYNTDQMAEFAEQANKAAKALSTTTTDYTNASLIYFQQGLSDAEVEERTNVTIKMANATGTSAQVVSDQMTAIWNNFDDGSKSLEYYADVMTALGAATASSTDEISQGLQKFAAVSETVGLSYEYATAALTTIMSNTRESADVVGTALKTLFARIQGLQLGETLDDGTDLNKYSKALESVGITIYEQNGELKAMDSILNEMAAKWDTLSSAQQTALAQTVAGVRQYTQLVALMENWDNGDSDSFQANLGTIAGAEGALDEQAEIYAQSWEAAEKRVRAASEGIYQSLLDDDFFISINNGFANLLNGIDAFIDGAGGVKTILTGIASIAVSSFAHKIPQALDTFKYNLEFVTKGSQKAYENIQSQMTQATEKAFTDYNINPDSSTGFAIKQANELTAARTKLAAVSDKMSDSEKQAANTSLGLIEAYQQEILAIKQKNEELQSSINLQLQEASNTDTRDDIYLGGQSKGIDFAKNKDFSQLDLDSESIGEAVGSLNSQINNQLIANLQKANAEMKSFSDGAKTSFSLLSGESNSFAESITKIQEKINNLDDNSSIDTLRTQLLSFIETIPEGIRNSGDFKKAIEQIGKAKTPEELKEAFNILYKQMDNVTLKTSEFKKVMKEINPSINIDQIAKGMNNVSISASEAKDKVTILDRMLDEFQPTHVVRMSEAFGSLAGMMGNVVTIGNSVKSIFTSLSNPDLTGWEKFSTVFMSLSMIIPSVINLMSSYVTIISFLNNQIGKNILLTQTQVTAHNSEFIISNLLASTKKTLIKYLGEEQLQRLINIVAIEKEKGATESEIATKILDELASKNTISTKGKEIIARTLSKAAIDGETISLWGLVKALLATEVAGMAISGWLGIFAGIAAVIVGAAIAIDHFNISQKEANEMAKQSSESYDKLKQSYDNLQSSIKEIDSGYEALENMTRGTEEWQEAVVNLNDQIMELISLYPQLADAITLVDGVLTLDKNSEAWEEFLTSQKNALNFAKQSSYGTKMLSLEIENQDAYDKARIEIGTYSKYIDEGNGQGRYEDSFIDQSILETIVKSISQYGSGYTLTEDFLKNNLQIQDEGLINALLNNKSALEELSSTIKVNSASNKLYGEQIASSYLNTTDYANSEYNDEIVKAVGQNLINEQNKDDWAKTYKANENDLFGMSDAEVQKAYAKLMGYNTNLIKNNFGGTGTYYDMEGKEIGKITDEAARYALNQQRWLEQNTPENVEEVTELFNSITDETVKGLIQSAIDGTELTEEQLNLESIDDGLMKQLKVIFGEDIVGIINEALAQTIESAEINNFNLENWKSDYAASKDIVSELKVGDTIDQSEYDQLDAAAQQFFTNTGDGIYTLTQSAELLRDVVNDIAAQQLKDEIAEINNLGGISQKTANQQVSNIEAGNAAGMNFLNSGTNEAYIEDVNAKYGTSFTDFAEAVAYVNEKLAELQSNLASTADQLGELDNLMASGQISSGDYVNQLQVLATQYENCTDELANYQRALEEGNEEAANAADAALHGAIRAGELAKQYDLSAEAIEKYADELKDSGKYTESTDKVLVEMAKDQLRFDRAVENSRKNIKQWKQDLAIAAKTGHLASESAEQMAEAYGDLLDIDGDLLPSSFLKDTENLKLMEQALKGDEEAYQSLLDKSRQAIAMKIGLDDTAFQNGFNDLLNKYYQAQSLDDIQVGASLDNAGFLQGLTDMVNAANMTAAEATSYLASMGVDAEVVEEPTVSEDTQTYVSATPNISWHSSAGTNPVTGGPALYTFPEVHYSTSTETIPTSKTTTGVALRVTSANKSSGGAVKHGGSSAAASPSSGGGGGGSKSAPKHAEKKNDSDKTRYHTLQNQLEDLTAEYDTLSDAADKAFGQSKLDAIDDQIDKTDELIAKQEEYIQAIQTDLPIDKSVMTAYYNDVIGGPSIQFDEKGNISNYDQIQDAMFNKYNQMTSLDEDSEEWQMFEQQYEQLEKYIEQYEETYDLLREEEANYQDLLNQRLDLELEKVQYKVEIELAVPEDEIAIIEYQLGKVEDDAFKAAESIGLLTEQAEAVYDQIEINKQGLNEALELSLSVAEINELMAGNMDVLNGKNFTEDQIDTIREYKDNLLDLNEEFDDIRESIEDKVLEVFDAWHEKLEEGVDKFDHYGSILESYKNIIDIVGKDVLGVSDTIIGDLAQANVENAINQVKATKDAYKALQQAQIDAEEELEKAKARGDEQSIQFWTDTLNEIQIQAEDAQEEMMSAWEEALDRIVEQFEAAVQTAVDAFNEAVYQLGGIEALSNEFDRQQEMADMYLDDYQKIYELSKLNRDINNSIDDTDSLAGKQKLKKLLSEINELQADGVKMSQYDLEYLQAEYDLRLAEIALEEAQRAKDVVRLQKDNEGNWSYVYTQNTDAVDEAQQKYEDALYAMQDLSSNYIDEMSQQLIETSQEMQEALAAIRVEDYASIDDYYEEVERIQEQYQEEIAMQEAELQKAVDNNKELYDTDWTNYHNATGYKISDTEDFVTKFSDSLLGTLMNSESATVNFGTILGEATDNLVNELYLAAENYYTNLANIMNAAGTSTDGFAEDLAENVDQIKEDSEEAATAVEDMATRMQEQMDNVMNKVAEWQRTYGEAMQEIINANLGVIESFNEMLATLSMDDSTVTVKYDIQNANQDIADASQFDTGGYTGSWGNTGKFAVLHEKELILSADDTYNMLKAMEISKLILDTIELNAQQASNGMGQLTATTVKEETSQVLEQMVQITAEFPNAIDHNEIQEAFNNLINYSSQYANRK